MHTPLGKKDHTHKLSKKHSNDEKIEKRQGWGLPKTDYIAIGIVVAFIVGLGAWFCYRKKKRDARVRNEV